MLTHEQFVQCVRELLNCPEHHAQISEKYLLDWVLPDTCDPAAFRRALDLAYKMGEESKEAS